MVSQSDVMFICQQRFQAGAGVGPLFGGGHVATCVLHPEGIFDVPGGVGHHTKEGRLSTVHWHLAVKVGGHCSRHQTETEMKRTARTGT